MNECIVCEDHCDIDDEDVVSVEAHGTHIRFHSGCSDSEEGKHAIVEALLTAHENRND